MKTGMRYGNAPEYQDYPNIHCHIRIGRTPIGQAESVLHGHPSGGVEHEHPVWMIFRDQRRWRHRVWLWFLYRIGGKLPGSRRVLGLFGLMH